MSSAPRPEAVSLAPGAGELPQSLAEALSDPDTRLLLVVAPDSGDAALRTAIALAEARAARGLDTVLADAGFGDPRLHEILDAPNLEGLADVFEFGASLGRVMTRPETRRFDFIPTGAYVPEPAAILESERWDRLVDELAADGAAMLLFVPADTPGLEAVSARAGRAILVGDERAVERSAGRLAGSCEVVAVVEPAAPVSPQRLAAEAGDRAGDFDATIFDDPELTEPIVFRSDRRKRSLVKPLVWLLVLAALGAGGWFGYHEFVAGPSPNDAAAATTPAQGSAPEPEPQPVETPVGYSVAIEAHQDLALAQDRVARLRRAEPGVRFYVVPVSVRGSLYYRVLAGPVVDQEAGMTLMRFLVDRGHKTDLDTWAVRPTTLAFHLGEYGSSDQAEARVSTLAQRDIPSYIVMVRYEPGQPRYRVYGGAFEDQQAAVVMREMLDAAGLDDVRLVTRVGEPITVDS